MASGGDVFAVDMGEPIRSADLALRMAELSGMTMRDADNPAGDSRDPGGRPAPRRKALRRAVDRDNPLPTLHPPILKARDDFLPWGELSPQLERLKAALEINDAPSIGQHLQHRVLGYRPRGEVVDWVHLEQRAELAVAGL